VSSVAQTFSNPVLSENFPDPCALREGDLWYAYGTNGPRGNVPLMVSTDLVKWSGRGDALPTLGSWANAGHTWAPDVIRVDSGDYVLYYTARCREHDCQAIGVATAATPAGPFVDGSASPLLCQSTDGGSIDANAFRDTDGALYLYWKNDGNAIGEVTHIYGQALAADGLSLAGDREILLTTGAAWQGTLVEAPQMVLRPAPGQTGGRYLFYSANAYDTDAYAVGYAVCDGPLGPCHDSPRNPILTSSADAAGPGHGYVVETGEGESWMLYHAWEPTAVGEDPPGRYLWLDRVEWVDDGPVMRGPISAPQPVPRV
jgi:beta-xylosidase